MNSISQVDEYTLRAFGIEVSSVNDSENQINELLEFARYCASQEVATYVKRAYYEAYSGICKFELDFQMPIDYDVVTRVFEAARNTISRFEWFGVVHDEILAGHRRWRFDRRQ